jgi:hypothetical protein
LTARHHCSDCGWFLCRIFVRINDLNPFLLFSK